MSLSGSRTAVVASSGGVPFFPTDLSGLSLWLKADAGVTSSYNTYVSQIILTCTGGLSSYSGTYIATSTPDADGVYSLFCSANSKTIVKDGNFIIETDFILASSGDGVSWSLQNVLVVGLTISGATGSHTGANGVYVLNERGGSSGGIIRDNENGYYAFVDIYGAVEISDPNNVVYSNSSFGSGAWTNEDGTGTVTATSIQLDPSGTVSGSVTTSNYGDPLVTAWADQSGNSKNFSGDAIFSDNYINGKPAIYFNGTDSYLDSPSTLLDNFSQISLFGVWSIPADQANKGIFGTSNYSNLEITANPSVMARIRNGSTSPTFIPSSFSNLGAWTISYFDAQNQSGVFYKNGTEALETFVSQIVLTGAGTTTSNGTYTRSAGGETSFNGPNGNSIDFNGDYWMVYDDTFAGDTYFIAFDFSGNWQIEGGDPDAPTGTNTTTTAPIANGSVVQMPLASGVTYSLGRYAFPDYEGLNAEMHLAEFIIYNTRLTTPQRQQVEAYLNAKYAIY